jgi:hypothetical protein
MAHILWVNAPRVSDVGLKDNSEQATGFQEECAASRSTLGINQSLPTTVRPISSTLVQSLRHSGVRRTEDNSSAPAVAWRRCLRIEIDDCGGMSGKCRCDRESKRDRGFSHSALLAD